MTQEFRRFGQYEVILLRDGSFEAPADILTHADGAAARSNTIEAWGKPTIRLPVNCFALRDAEGIALVDAGSGTSWGPAFGHARAAMRSIGIEPDHVRRALLTHIHGDHALGLFDGEAPYFPYAEALAPDRDFAFFTDAQAREATPQGRRGGFAIAEQLHRVYGARLRRIDEGSILPGVEAISLPGHTPGHTGYLVHGESENLLIWGDILHLEDFQPADPRIGLVYDVDSETAVRTRYAILERAAHEDWIIAGSHVSGFSRVRRAGSGFRIIAA